MVDYLAIMMRAEAVAKASRNAGTIDLSFNRRKTDGRGTSPHPADCSECEHRDTVSDRGQDERNIRQIQVCNQIAKSSKIDKRHSVNLWVGGFTHRAPKSRRNAR